MAQGDNKTGTVGTNAMFVMTHDDIAQLRGKKYTYANIVLDHRPQKDDPNRIRITAGGDKIQYNDELLGRKYMTVLMALSSIAVEQTTATEKTMKRCHQLLDYLATNFEAKV
jgi:hypothetical protein